MWHGSTRAILLGASLMTSAIVTGSAPNVLFVVSDDLRPEMGMYGGNAITPAFDKFATLPGTVVFDRAYVQQAICCPTRSSFLLGRRPDTTKVWDLKTQFRISGGKDWVTLPQFFRKNGYYTAGMGKVFHPVEYEGKIDDVAGGSWTAPYFHAQGTQGSNMTMCWTVNPAPDGEFVDMMLAAHAVETLKNVSKLSVPFFVAVGYHRPHLPWDVPAHFYDLYPEDSIELADHNRIPTGYNVTGAQPWSWDPESGPRHCGPLKQEGTTMTEYALVPDNLAKKFRRGYYAAVSQTDHNFGILLDALDAFGLNSTTIVAFVGDHGWQLGDLGEFGKKTNFERATRAPFIIRDPRHKVPAGRSSALIEFVDLMPTLIDLAGFTVPTTCPEDSRLVALCVEGASLSPVLHNPNQTEDWKAAAFMQYAHCMHDEGFWHDGCSDPAEPKVMGYAIRTRRWRYIEWVGFNKTTTPPTIHWDAVFGTELYDHTDDDTVANVAESANVVAVAANAATVKQLSGMLHRGWRATQ
eukprot:m.123492 g.123492  ORF g.123492 m.123492 type:complete len:522 (-) comp22016_c0_seq5:66-1631(-)